uniref:DUF7755 domain-containing protein n=1 Tax=Dunaliella tertiolecta TaxID=3047 RepID=A0A7S3R653_DUNTE|mmetsp:Transcript_5654/g.13336  ORF Transcript_5654/g.13336 Transcript_5654/m.13336 type:complete len:501 (+) Transcript_5654:38-1540(+)|eukprot:CAMPEP_0202372298 /NCGR_PEP_ID=MMETSP1127-20130417/3521_1 /ASSEMBLY_ACC=CAM_ASM_000462 /TAXON_ID=3047 /ORGANISM="Dunaliella tertiolecta, Strain CCMP1320" /LENGTH=500 /DNA_ID=CAMNT_0048968793 /DNA_START=23 /DNA_END=1525 /DNA_ORIENTATION=+
MQSYPLSKMHYGKSFQLHRPGFFDGANLSPVAVHSKREERRPSNTPGVFPSVAITSLKETKSLRDLDSVALTKQAEGQQGTGSANVHTAFKEQGTPLTVYSVRFSTGNSRGAALSERACVNVCLVAKDGRAAMHRVSPMFDPRQDMLDMEDACQVLEDGGLGADCVRGMRASSSTSSSSSSNSSSSEPALDDVNEDSDLSVKPRVRFQEGSVDEVCFIAPELGKLAGILVGTESGSWGLEEVDVASSRTGAVHRFVNHSFLGAQRGEGACFLKPVPAGSVIYGTGSSAQALSKEEALAKRAANLASYASLKQRLLTTNALLVVSGGALTALLTGSSDAAASFAVGGSAGVLYQWLLQQSVDSMADVSGAPSNLALAVKEQGAAGAPRPVASEAGQQNSIQGLDAPHSSQIAASGGAGVRRALGRPAVRLVLLAALGFGGASWLQGQGTGIDVASGGGMFKVASLDEAQLTQLVVGILGFLTYKISLISVSIAPEEQPQQQ